MIMADLIDLRFSSVEAPTPEPRKTIYSDLVNLPDPVVIGVTVRAFNYDSVGLYMKVDATLAGWTFTETNLGLLGAGANVYVNLDDFGSRAKPGAEITETIALRLRAYTDSGYTDLKWTFQRNLSVIFIKSDDGSWATDLLNDFDDGTVQGWAAELLVDGTGSVCEVAMDYVLSAPFSCRMDQYYFRQDNYLGQAYLHGLYIWTDTVEIIHLGKAYTSQSKTDYVPRDKWIRCVIPVSANDTFELGIVADWNFNSGGTFWTRQMKGRLYKSITTPSASEVFVIINMRARRYAENLGPSTSNNWHAVIQIDDFLVISR